MKNGLSTFNSLFIGLLLTLLTLSSLSLDNGNSSQSTILKDDYPKLADFWEFNYSINNTIHVKNNWTAVAGKDWCSDGDGSWADPYIIENITVDAFNISSCIIIEDSREYFVIRNCTFFNSSSIGISAGIKLNNVTNGLIEINPIYENRYGIWMNNTHNCTFNKNPIHHNLLDGIYMLNCENNTFYQNGIRYNEGSGFDVNSCTLNIFDDNIVRESEEYGIIFRSSDNNTVKFSTFDHCDNYGIYLDEDSDKNWIIENYVGYCKAKEDDGECIYIIDKGENNKLIFNDCVGDCEEDPVYGELDGPEAIIPGYSLMILGLIMTISSLVYYAIKRR